MGKMVREVLDYKEKTLLIPRKGKENPMGKKG